MSIFDKFKRKKNKPQEEVIKSDVEPAEEDMFSIKGVEDPLGTTTNSMSGKFDKFYNPAQAENGKFVVLDTNTLNDYPSAGKGKYAVLSYIVNPVPIQSIISVSSVNVTDPIRIEGIVPISAADIPNSTYNMSSAYVGNTVHTVSFPTQINHLEISVKSGSTYLALNDGTAHTIGSLSAEGMFLQTGAYYQNDYAVSSIKFGSTSNADLRIFGNYRS